MGYDFMLFRLRAALGPLPAAIPPDLDEDAFVPIDDATPLFDAMRASSLVAAGTLGPGARGLRWRTPDGGQLELSAGGPTITIDTHAHWDHVAQVLDLALGAWPDVVLFDMQTANLHDAASFRAFIARSYAEKARHEARQAADKRSRDGGA